MLVGLAKYFAKQPKPKHTLMFVASGGHHGPGNGPTSLVAAHPELKDGTVLILNLEHVAYADVVRGKVRATEQHRHDAGRPASRRAAKAVGVTNESPFLFDLWKQASRCYGVATYQSAGHDGVRRSRRLPAAQRADDADDPVGHVLSLVRRRATRRCRPKGIERAARFHAFLHRAGRPGAGAADRGRQRHAVSVRAAGLPMTRLQSCRLET